MINVTLCVTFQRIVNFIFTQSSIISNIFYFFLELIGGKKLTVSPNDDPSFCLVSLGPLLKGLSCVCLLQVEDSKLLWPSGTLSLLQSSLLLPEVFYFFKSTELLVNELLSVLFKGLIMGTLIGRTKRLLTGL